MFTTASDPIHIRPITEAEITMVNSRDMDGSYPYLGLFAMDHRDNLDARCFTSEEQIVAYGLAGVHTRNGKRIGEVGMVHVSPAVRGLGLGSLMSLAIREPLISQQPDVLEAKIGDDSGKIEHLMRLLGYSFSGISDGAGKHPVWTKDLLSDEDRSAFGFTLDREIKRRLDILRDKTDTLALKARTVDKDNPHSTNIALAVAERIKNSGTLANDSGITYFGYVGAPVRIAQSVKNGDYGHSIMLDLKGADPNKVSQLLKEDENFKLSNLETYQQGSTPTLRVSSPLTLNSVELTAYTSRLANVAAELYGQD